LTLQPSKEAVSKALRAVLDHHNISEAEAARRLDVSRESFNKYVRGKTAPNRHVLAKARELWEPIMAEHGVRDATAHARPMQLELFSEELKGARAIVRIESKSSSQVDLALTIKIA
jgi:transcriptional regulator with XRE-family HTH domain